MGKGQIVSGGTNGQYQVKIIYAYRSRVEAKITQLQQDKTAVDARITALDALIAAETDQKKREAYILERSVLRLQSASIQKQVEYYQNGMPADPTRTAWCADLTEDLTGYVGTVEIPGEDALILIRPGYSGRATYTAARDGQLMPAIAGSANQVLFNWMILPGWQRHKPIYRAGTIVPDSLDFDANTCSVCLDAAYSSQQSLPATDGAGVTDCDMGDDPQAEYLTAAGEDFCSRNPGHPFCTQGEGSEILLTDAMLAQLREVNYSVNGAHSYAGDKSGVAVGDQWDVMSAGQSGDCEDFALTKMQRLVDNYGWNPDNLKLVTAYAKNGGYHAMLGVRTTNRGLVVLDSNYNEVMESARVPYRIDKIALASDTWVNYSRRLNNVPIEYMTCGAAAFADGDRVVVEFTGQSWASPKVIGFLESPEPCQCDAWVLGNNGLGANDYSHWVYRSQTDVWVKVGEIPGYEYGGWVFRIFMAAAGRGQTFYLFGGTGETVDLGGGIIETREDRADKYSLGSWTTLQDLPTNYAMTAVGLQSGGKNRVMSGYKYYEKNISYFVYYYFEPTLNNYEYDADANSWSNKTNVPSARCEPCSFVLGGYGFYFGGVTERPHTPRSGPEADSGVPLSTPETVFKYNHNGNSWSSEQSMLRGRWRNGTASNGNYGYLFNGYVTIENAAAGDVSMYEPLYAGYDTRRVERYSYDSDSWAFVADIRIEKPPATTDYIGSSNVASEGASGYGFTDLWAEFDFNSFTLTWKAGHSFAQGMSSQMTYHSVLAA